MALFYIVAILQLLFTADYIREFLACFMPKVRVLRRHFACFKQNVCISALKALLVTMSGEAVNSNILHSVNNGTVLLRRLNIAIYICLNYQLYSAKSLDVLQLHLHFLQMHPIIYASENLVIYNFRNNNNNFGKNVKNY